MTGSAPNELTEEVVRHAALAPRLFVASDFDGVLSPIVSDPEQARPLQGSIDALGRLAALRETTVAIVSGRERQWLQRMVPDPERFILVGSHGAEMGDDAGLTAEQQTELTDLTAALHALAESCPGLWVEPKTLATAVHLRRADAACRERAAASIEEMTTQWSGKVVRGKEVVEYTTATATKGDAVATLRSRIQPQRSVFFGDDVTDEDAFAVLGTDDVSVKVGPGPTKAQYRVQTPEQVTEALVLLADLRCSE